MQKTQTKKIMIPSTLSPKRRRALTKRFSKMTKEELGHTFNALFLDKA